MGWVAEASVVVGIALHHHSSGEAHGPCPECGGDDRFIVKESGWYWCRQCHYKGYWIPKEQIGEAREREKVHRDLAARQAAFELARDGCRWQAYHEECISNSKAMDLWAESGISEWSVRKWGLGWCASCPTFPSSESLTIPVFYKGRLVDIRHRLLFPTEDSGKYRTEFPGTRPWFFNADAIQAGPFLLVEGEKKTIVLDSFGIRAVGLQGLSQGIKPLLTLVPSEKWLVIVALDPGQQEQIAATRIALQLLEKCHARIADFVQKPDDFVTRYGAGLAMEVIKQSRPIGVFKVRSQVLS
jgi:hypothetical protein